ncbi:MAG: polysaccharide biosynthesis/export family protein [Novosphingobium sp.]|nr:polysaccharide biosynthesis/export family protein [Novosphingobium sp.]
MIWARVPTLVCVLAALAGCAGSRPSGLPQGPAAYAVIPAAPGSPPAPAVRTLRAGDAISVSVFREAELSAEKVVLDELGNVQLPALGELAAARRTPREFAEQVAARLGERFLRNPRVTVALVSAVAEAVAVEGQVGTPGLYPLSRNETLLTSLARAGSPTQLAELDEVVVFRTVNGQRMGAVFDVRKIRTGNAPDPQIVDGDLVVVGFSQLKGAYRDFLAATPLLGLFTIF